MEEKYFAELLSSFINETDASCYPECNWEEVIRLGKIHMTGGMLYPVVKKAGEKNNLSENVLDKLEEFYFKTITDSTNRIYEEEKILTELYEENIKCIVIKGSVIKEFYPVPELRSMGDVDLVISEDDRKRADRVFRKNGGVLVETEESVFSYKIKNTVFELHTRFCDESEDKPKTRDYYKKMWEHTVEYKCGQFVLDSNFHFIITMIHLYHHFSEGGCGIRHFMDIAVMIKNDNTLDYSYIKNELEKLELIKFAGLVSGLCNKWFDMPDVFECRYDDEVLNTASDYILKCGVFGGEVSTTAHKSVRKKAKNKKGLSLFFFKIGFLISRAFPNYKKMCYIYPKVKRNPFLLPAFWIKNALHQIKLRGKYLAKYSADIFASDAESKQIYELFDKLDL